MFPLITACPVYKAGFRAWVFEQARRVRAGEPLYVENVAEELESLGRHEEPLLETRLTVLMTHVLRCQFDPDRHVPRWGLIIEVQRHEIAGLLKDNPSLRRSTRPCGRPMSRPNCTPATTSSSTPMSSMECCQPAARGPWKKF